MAGLGLNLLLLLLLLLMDELLPGDTESRDLVLVREQGSRMLLWTHAISGHNRFFDLSGIVLQFIDCWLG